MNLFTIVKDIPRISEWVWEVAVWLAGGGSVALLFRKKIINGTKFIYNRIPLVKRVAWLESQNTMLVDMKSTSEAILRELKPNAGSSLRDVVDSMSDTVSKIAARTKNNENGLGYATFSTDELGFFGSVNQIFCEWAQKSEYELLGNNWINSLHVDDRDFAKRQLLAAIFDLRELEIDFRMQVNGSVYFKVRCIAKPVYNGKKLVSYLGTLKKL